MSSCKKEKRYNAFIKRTDSGIIVKTVDSVTGVESLIKFTSDSIVLPGEQYENDCPKGNVKPLMKNSDEGNHHVNKKKKYVLSKRNPKIITKLSKLRPYLKELKPNIPDFHVYEDTSSSTSDFQNHNIIFVANSKMAKDGVINLNIPGKLVNVCYHGGLNENGVVKFKAKSVIKPFTIIIGDYVVNVNICHNLTQNSYKLKITDDGVLSCKGSVNTINDEKCADIKKADIESKDNEIKCKEFIKDCAVKMDDETTDIPDSSYGSLEGKTSNETVKSDTYDGKFKKEKISEFLTHVSKSTQTEPIVSEVSLEQSLPKQTNHTEEIKTKPSHSARSLVNKFILLGDNSLEDITEPSGAHCNTCSTHISQTVGSSERCKTLHNTPSVRDCMSSESNTSVLPRHSKCFSMKHTSFSTDYIVDGFEVGNLTMNNNLGTEPITEFDDGSAHITKESVERRPNGRCSNASLLEVKKKLSEATASLHQLCSVIEHMNNFREESPSEETIGENQPKILYEKLDKFNQGSSHIDNLNSSTISLTDRTDEIYPYNESKVNTSYTKVTNCLKNQNNSYLECGLENLLQKNVEETAISKQVSTCIRNECSEVDKLHSVSKELKEKHINAIEKTENQFSFSAKRQFQSLTNLPETTLPCVDNFYKSDGNSDSLFENDKTKTDPNVFFRTDYFLGADELRRGEIVIESPGKVNGNSAIMVGKSPRMVHNDTLLSEERSYTSGMRFNKELDSGTNMGQENHMSDPRMDTYSTNSIKTIYIKTDCTSSNNLTMPVQLSSMKIFHHDTNEINNNYIYLTNPKPSSEEKTKNSFSQKIKQKYTNLKTQLLTTVNQYNRKESDSKEPSGKEKSDELEIMSNTKNISLENLVCLTENPKLNKDLNCNRSNIHYEVRNSKFVPSSKSTTCSHCSQVPTDIGIKDPYAVKLTQERNNTNLTAPDALDQNCIIDPSVMLSPLSSFSFT